MDRAPKAEPAPPRDAPFTLPLSREAAGRYDATPLPGPGLFVDLDIHGVRKLAGRVNQARADAGAPAGYVAPADVQAAALLNAILCSVALTYGDEALPGGWDRAWKARAERAGPEEPAATVATSLDLFPMSSSNRVLGLPRLLLLRIANENPALAPLAFLFDDDGLDRASAYRAEEAELEAFLAQEPPFGPRGQTLPDLLRAPMRASPDSLAGQLRYIREHWGFALSRTRWFALLRSLDVLAEAELRWAPGGATREPGLAHWGDAEAEPEAFSTDLDWMPSVVLMAKSVYVWLHQLSRTWGRSIERLDQIPDEELDRLAGWGFTGLWLIGLWERSSASRDIKRRMGNPEAEASAYAIYDYEISRDLGGEEAFQALKARAWARGIRLAGDMVPNHMGIDSRWVRDHPERFMARPDPPFPWYGFDGPDLSTEPGVSLRLENRYWDRTDAAVVFQRRDNATGEVTYVYHGNDGTGMPWNDTAQLDFLRAGTRAAVLEAILAVAAKFPIIRFDAAMTLTHRHFQRLWYPPPGEGGAIPTRAELGCTREAFRAAFPVEFWREVVDAVAERAPDTLLLAEAFWLMEGYFVRSLGMHRVYNSAFMNMLKLEENAKYRAVLRDVLSFDPEVLRRFVNFMNNPDEDTAVAQFGKGDKYFGVATLMVTLPGLPLFGHGQIEGFGEKYGMEYRRAYWDESPDPDFVARHEREIFPLLRRRALFSGAAHFALFDFETDGGSPNEDVFAYANRAGPDRALVVYHNRFGDTRGRVRRAAGTGATLARALDLPAGEDDVWTWTDLRTGLHHMGRGRRLAEEGLAMALGAYACHVLLDMRAVRDPGAGALCDWLAGRGVDSLEEASRQRERERAGSALSRALARASVESLFAGPARGEGKVLFVERMDAVLSALERLHAPARPRAALLAELGERARRAAGLDAPSPFLRSVVAASLVVAVLDEATGAEQEGEELVTAEGMAALQAALSHPAPDGERALLLSRLAARAGLDRCQDPCEVLPDLLDRDGAATFLGVNLHDGILWFSREGLADLLAGLEAVWAVVHPGGGAEAAAGAGAAWLGLGEAHGWRWEPFRRAAAQEEEEGGEEPDGGRV